MTARTAEWLHQLVGDWTYTFSTAADSEHAGYTATGGETVRRISDDFVAIENTGVGSDGAPSKAVTLVGYEPDRDVFTGAVAGTATAKLWVYEGRLSEDGQALLLETEGPAMTEGRATDRYRDVLRIIDADHRYMAAEVLRDGAWTEFMRTEFVRR